jgi:competence protein ComEC
MPGHEESSRSKVSASARRPALVLVLSFIIGICLHAAAPHCPQIWLILSTVFAIVAAILFHQPRLCSVLLILAIVNAGIAIAQIEAFYYPADTIAAYATDDPRLAWLELQIDHEPRVLSDPFSTHPLPPKQVVTAAVKRVKTWSGWIDCSGDMLVQIAQPHPGLALGQRVRVLGLLERPAPAMNPGQFNWADYYREQRILTSLHIAQAHNITILGTTRIGPIDYLRSRSRELLAEGFSSDQSLDHALLRALIVGDKDPELRDIQEQFRRTGTSHHLAISGMHVAVLGAFVYGICRLLRLRPRWAVSIGLCFTVLYGVIALPSPPVIRSVLLCVFFGIGVLLCRTRDPIQLLGLSVFAMLIYHPLDLYNAGFQLGIGTVLALMIFARPFTEFMRRLRGDEPFDPNRKLSLRQRVARRIDGGFYDTFSIAILAWVVSMPLIIYHFNQINPWAIVSGILLAPFVVLALIGGFAKIILTLLWPSMSGMWALMAVVPVEWMRHVLEWLAKLPGSDFPIPSMPLWMLLAIYATFLLMLVPMKRPKLKLLVKLVPVAACISAVTLPMRRVETAILPDEMNVTLLSLGAGQCAVVETPSGKTLMVDAGSSSFSDLLGKCIEPYLRATRHTTIDTMLLTHSDYDHISAAGAVAQVYEVREVMVGNQFREHARMSAPAEQLLRTFDVLDIPPRVVSPGQHIPLGRGADLEILWPPLRGPELSSNDSALVSQLRYAGRSILITGDIQDAAEAGLLKTPELLHADVLIAPHHGSSESTTAGFVRAVDPTYILSSNDRTLTGKQKHFELLVGKSQLFRTNRCGAITVHISKDGEIRVETFLHPGAN